MKKNIDLRGLTCPEPVLRTKKLIDDKTVNAIEALVDSEVNVENLARLAKSQNLLFQKLKLDDHFKIEITRDDSAKVAEMEATPAEAADSAQNRKVGEVIFITRDTFGQGASEADHDFSNNLLNVFLQTVFSSGHKPRAILLANSGVKLMDPDGPCAKVLSDFHLAAVPVLGCGLCLEYYGLKEKIPLEQITNMFAICEYLFAAEKILSP